MAGDLGGAAGPDGLFHPLREQREGVVVDGPALTGLADTTHDLRPAEGFGDATALDDRENRLLDGREPLAALGARSAATDQLTVVGLS
ncbi:hypothetical protein Acsp01_51250 [Actinoplanes sp. NBRC 101535]|nr:hypothetical protein Acsp01_51250 [Actinoplanes sp. NBRC 101535]